MKANARISLVFSVACSLNSCWPNVKLWHLPELHKVYGRFIRQTTGGDAGMETLGVEAQTQAKPELLLLHPSGQVPSYEVATIKLINPDAASRLVSLPPGVTLSPLSVRRYIMDAYGATYASQVVGGPDWLNKDAYQIKGKASEDFEAALQKISRKEQYDQNRIMQQSLLADRFHLKAHFETHVLPVYELVPAKGGLRMVEVPAPPERRPGDPPLSVRPGAPLPPGTSMTTTNSNGLRILNGRAIKLQSLARVMSGDIGDRPIVDHTGFSGFFDITELTWAPLGEGGGTSVLDGPSLPTALEEKLGVRIVAGRDPIEVLVIDGIERPTPN